MGEEEKDNGSNMGCICANITLACLAICIIALTMKFVMWLF